MELSMMIRNEPFVIAEIANAHQGDIHQLVSLVEIASESKADAVKFQWFKYDCLATMDYEWYEDYMKLFISENHWGNVLKLAKNRGIEAWVDIFDYWGVELALKSMDEIDGIKLPPTVMQDDSLLEFALSTDKPILLGVGGWYDDEIDTFLKKIPDNKKEKITLMHGFQGYPTKPEDANLVKISYLRNRYGIDVGFADHEDASSHLSVDLPVYAFFAGATVIEKHITLDRSLKGYDHYSSLEANEFKIMVEKLQTAKIIKGNNSINENQRNYLKAAIKAVAKTDIKAGQVVDKTNIVYKRCPSEDALTPDKINGPIPLISTASILKDKPVTKNNIRKLNIVIAVICRLKSTRLPQKAIRNIYGISSIERCLTNCLAIKGVSQVVLATSDLESDKALGNYNLNGKIDVVFGDAENVLNRMIKVADQYKADILLRITGDCPSVAPEIIEYLINSHIQKKSDFTTADEKCAVGIGADVYNVSALRKLEKLTQDPEYTEYLSYYFKTNPDLFDINIVELPAKWQYPQWRLTLDEPKDLEMFEELYRRINIGNQPLYFSQIVDIMKKNPDIPKINCSVNLKWKVDKDLVERLNKDTRIKII